VNTLRTAALAAATLLSLAPLAVSAASLNPGSVPSGTVIVKATVVPDCQFSTQPASILDFGTQDKLAGTLLKTSVSSPLAITCNNGSAWTASVPPSISLTGYTDQTKATTNGANIPVTLGLDSTSGIAPGVATPVSLNVTASVAPSDYAVGYYEGSFVVTVSY
jgi:spore coat protein U-like protein